MAPRLISIQVGRPRHLGILGAADPFDRPWSSAIFKQAAAGPLWLAAGNLAGDQQADLDRSAALDLAGCEWLAEGWRRRLAQVAVAQSPSGS